MYLVFTRMPRESYRRQPKSLLSYLCYVFRALINSLVWRRTQFSPTGPLPCQMTKWNHHLFFQIESTEQCTCEVFKPTLRLALLTGRYRPAVVGLQQTFLTDSKSPSFTGFNILTKYSLKDRATGGVSLLINDSYLFSEVHLNTPVQAVAARVTLDKVVTFCSIYLPPSDHVAKTDLISLIEQLQSLFVFWATSTVIPQRQKAQ